MSDLKTIDEWVEAGQKLGEMKLVASIQGCLYFTPFFISSDGFWHGLIDGEISYKFEKDCALCLYTEPKPKVVRWLWRIKGPNAKRWLELCEFLSDDEATEYFTCGEKYFKNQWTRTEFED